MLAVARVEPLPPGARLPPLERYGVRAFSVGMLIGEQQAVLMDGRFIGPLVRQLIDDIARGPLDVLLLDLPPGIAEPHGTLARERRLRGVVAVTTPREMARVDTGHFVRFFEAAGVPIVGVALNMSSFECPDRGARHAIWPRHAAPGDALAHPVLAEVPIAPAIAAAGDSGRPVVVTQPGSGPARAFLEAARRFLARVEELGIP